MTIARSHIRKDLAVWRHHLLGVELFELFVTLLNELLSKSMFEKCLAVKTATTSTKSACADSRKIRDSRNRRRQVLYL
jgi:hypothetical protein